MTSLKLFQHPCQIEMVLIEKVMSPAIPDSYASYNKYEPDSKEGIPCPKSDTQQSELNGCFSGHWAICFKYLAKKGNRRKFVERLKARKNVTNDASLSIDEFHKDFSLEMLVLVAKKGKT